MKLTPAGLILGLLAGLGCGTAAGYWFGQKTSAARSPVDVTQRPGPSQPPESAVPSIAPGIDVASVASFGAARARITDQFAELLKIDSPTTRAYKLEQLFASMALEDAPDILASILAVENARDRSRLVGPFFKQWGKLDGPGAVAKAKELFGRDKRSAMSSAMTGWAEKDPFAAWEVAKEQVPGASPYTASQFSGVVTELAKRDLHAAFAAYAIADNRWSRSRIQYSLMEAAFETDQVPALVSMARELGDSQEREEWISHIFNRWGETDTGAPLEAMRGISDQVMAKKAMEGFLQGWMQADPTGAIDYAIANHAEPLVTDAVGPLMSSAFFQGTRDENYELAARIAEAGLLEKAAPRMLAAVAMSDPRLALHMASLVSDPEASEAFTQNAIATWAFNEFDAASAYVSQMPASDLKTRTIGVVAWSAMRREGGGAQIAAWMQDVPAGKERTKVVERLLAAAVSPYAEVKPGFLPALKKIAAGESGLSEEAVKHRDKLFGAVEAPPAP